MKALPEHGYLTIVDFHDIRFGDCPSLSPQISFKVCDLRTVVVSPVFVTTKKAQKGSATVNFGRDFRALSKCAGG